MEGKVLLTQAPHPFKAARELVYVPEGLTIQQMLEVAQPDPMLARHAVIFIGGEQIPRAMWPRVRPKEGAHVELRVLPSGGGGGGKNPLRTLLTLAVVAASFIMGPVVGAGIFGSSLVNAGLSVGLTVGQGIALTSAIGSAIVTGLGNLLVNAIAPVRPPQLPTLSSPSGSSRSSPSFFLEGARNQARPFSPVPVVLGKHRMVPPHGVAPYTEMVGDKQYLRMLFVWGVGPLSIDTSTLKIGETPITDFTGVRMEHREGYSSDDPITIIPEQVIQTEMSVLLKQVDGFVSRTSEDDSDELGVDFSFPQGLVYFGDQGNRANASVTVQVQFRKVGDATWLTPTFTAYTVPESWIDGDEITFTHRRETAIRHGFRWSVAERGQYEIRVQRTSADTSVTFIFDLVHWSSIRSIKSENPINSPVPLAMTAIEIQATDQLNGVVDEFNGIVTSKGLDWDASLSTPAWVADQETQNPASLFRLVLQGSGIAEVLPDTRLDLEALQDFHEFCETNNFKFNMIRDFSASVWDVLADVCSAGRAAPTVVDGKWSVVIDQEQATPVSHITPQNSFDFQVEKDFIDLPHAWRIRFLNEDEDYRQDERRVYRTGYTSANATKFEGLEFPGVTDPDQIFYLGRFRIVEAEYHPERVTFQQDMEYLTYRRGDRVSVTHDVLLLGLSSGRVKDVEVDSNNDVTGLTLDTAVPMEAATDYGIALRLRSNAKVVRQVVTDPGDQTVITLSSAITNVGGEPAVRRGDIFGFGLLGSETDDFSIISIQPTGDFRARMRAVPYRSQIYDTTSETLEPFTTNLTAIPTIPTPAVRQVISDESILAYGPGEALRVRIAIEFDPLNGEAFDGSWVEVQARPSATGEPFFNATIEMQEANQVILGGIRDGETWDIRLRFRVPNRLPGSWAYIYNHKIVGRSSAPSALSGMTISVFGGQAHIRWTRPTELDVQFGGEVQFRHSPAFSGASWSSSTSIGEAAHARTLFAVLPLKGGTYLARVYDVAGNPSEVVSVTTKQASVLTFAAATTLDEDPTFSGTHTDTVVDSGNLQLNVDGTGAVLSTGTYEFASGYDFTTVTRVRLTTRITAANSNVLENIDSRTENIDTWDSFDGSDSSKGDAVVYVRSTDDDPAGTSPDWSAWERLDSAEFQARGFEFKVILTSEDPAFNVLISDLGIDAEELA